MLEHIKKFFSDRDRFAKHIGIELVEVSEGQATARVEIGEHLLNSANMIHGGAIFTLADFAFAAACNSYGKIALSINVSINFVLAAYEGVLEAKAREMTRQGKLSTYEVLVTNEKKEIIATFQGLAYHKKDPLIGLEKVMD